VVPQTGEMQGKRVGVSPNEHVFITIARASGHGAVFFFLEIHGSVHCR
jgi:hypothetical protein